MSASDGESVTRRNFVVRGAASVGVLAGAGSLIAACGSGTNKVATTGATGAAATTAAPPGPGTKRFKSLTAGASAPPLGLDPHKTTSTELQAFQEMFEPLINRMTDRSLVPALAQEPLTRLDDTTWSATLREGRTFSDGKPITVEDVKFSFDRILDPEFASPYLDYIKFIKGVTIVDKSTIHIVTTGPIEIVPDRSAVVRVVPMAVVKAKGDKAFSLDPGVGSGSMINSKPVTSNAIDLRVYEGYNGALPVYTDTASFQYIPEAETRVAQL
jgi:peptide/nickel transport system substrate-binding protein